MTTTHHDASLTYFSIVIPAHNEEHYIGRTLEQLAGLDYPKERHEVIVIENGSSDDTHSIMKSFEKENIRVFTIPGRGVSNAKNFGIVHISPTSDWVIFLDADTLLNKDFLLDVNDFLSLPAQQNCTVGTTELHPTVESTTANFWFAFYNLVHRLTKTSMAIQIFDRSLFPELRFSVNLQMGEDLDLIARARKYGNYFYFPTRGVHTSVRRFEQEGWIKVFLHWNLVALFPKNIQSLFDYKVVR